MACSVGLALVAFVFWFFLLAGSPLPRGAERLARGRARD
jgi:hypothetical protein